MADILQPGRSRRSDTPKSASGPAPQDTGQSHGTQPPQGLPPGPSILLAPGVRPLPEYELVHLLGRGGFGEVWKATGPGGFEVALKFIRLGDQSGRVELRALETMKNIRHANLLSMFGAWQRHDLLIIAMELADGTLWQRWHQAVEQGLPGIPRAELLECMRDAAKGIDFLNERRHPGGSSGELVGIQHKDIKPQNLLLVGGSVKVADFGLAKLLEHTVTNATGGLTPAYAAPEFFSGQATRWSDQYCLAITYCQLRGGRLPFEGSAVQIMAGHALREPDLTMLPEAERPALARALAKKPEERWPSCREFVEALAAKAPSARARRESKAPTDPLPATLQTERRRNTTRKPAPRPRPPETLTAVAVSPSRRWRKTALVGVIGLLMLSLAALLVWSALLWRGSRGPNRSWADTTPPPAGKRSEPQAPQGREQPAGPKLPPAPATPASLRLLPVGEVFVEPGKSNALEVRLERRNCTGPVRLEVEGLPEKVQAIPVTLAPDQDVGHVELTAAEDSGEAARQARVLASLGALHAEQPVRVTVKATSALQLAPLGSVTVQARQVRTVGVRLLRRNCPGPVKLRLEDLPQGVEAQPVLVPAGADAGRLELQVTGRAELMTREVRVVAEAAGFRAERAFQLTVGPARPPAEWVAEHTEAIRRAPKEPGNYLNRARAYLEQKEYDKALADCEQAIQLDPQYARAYSIRGVASFNQKEYDRVIEDCDKAIELDPREANAYRTRGNVHKARGDLDRAIADYDKAIELDPRDVQAYNSRGNAYLSKKEYNRAIEDYDRAIELDPKYAFAYHNRGLASKARGDLDVAIADYDRAIELDPRYTNAYINRSNAYLGKKEYDRVIKDCDKAIELDPQLAVAYHNRGLAHLSRKEYDQAIEDYDKAIERSPRYASAYNSRGNAYLGKKDYDRAIEDYDQAIAISPRYTLPYHNRGLAYQGKGDLDRAIADFDRTIELDPRYTNAYRNRAYAYGMKKEYDKAIEDFTKVVELEPRDSNAYISRGYTYLLKKDYDRAIEDCDQAIQLNPRSAVPYNNRGNAYLGKQDYNRAIEDYDKAIELDPRYAFAYHNRGLAYQRKGDLDRAIEDYDQAIEIDPRYINAYRDRANAYEKKGDSDRARADREKASSLSSSSSK